MREILISKIFWIIVIIIAIIIFIIGLNVQPAFRAEIKILFLPKNEIAAGNIDKIIGNAQKITKTLKFYNALLSADEGIEDSVENLPDDKRNGFWQSQIETQQLAGSHILNISILNENQLQALLMAEQVAHTLSQELSQYYNIRTELETRILDEPQVNYYASFQKFLSLLAWSLLIGFILPLIFFLINGLLSQATWPKQKNFTRKHKVNAVNSFTADKSKSKKSWESIVKKAPAPDNLPFDEQIVFNEVTREDKPNHIFNSLKEITKQNAAREATPEEVKARLNKLLSGEL